MKKKIEFTGAELNTLFALANNTYLDKEEFFSFDKRKIKTADRVMDKIIDSLRLTCKQKINTILTDGKKHSQNLKTN